MLQGAVGPTLVYGAAACEAKLQGEAGLSIWGSRWAGEMAAVDGDRGLASGTRSRLFLRGGGEKLKTETGWV